MTTNENSNDTLHQLVASLNLQADLTPAPWDTETLFGGEDSAFSRPSSSSAFQGPPDPPSDTISSLGTTSASASPAIVRRLSAMSTESATPSSSQRYARFNVSSTSMVSSAARQIPAVEKDVDDPSTPVDSRTSHHDSYGTPTALTKLLSAKTTISPEQSTEHSYVGGYNGTMARRM